MYDYLQNVKTKVRIVICRKFCLFSAEFYGTKVSIVGNPFVDTL